MVFESLESRLTLDSSSFNQELDSAGEKAQSFGDRMSDIGGRMQSVGTKLSLGLTAPIAGIAAASVKTASDVEEMQSKSEAVFGELTEDVRQWANTTAEEMGRSRFELEKMASGFQDLLVPMGATREEGKNMSQQLTTLSQDLSSFNNIPAEQVQRDLQSALTGSSETMKKYGVDVSAAAVNQELLNQGIEGGREEATRLQEAQARMNIVMRETSDAQGNAADTSDSFANQMRALKADTEELRAEIGQQLIPIAKSLVNRLRPLIQGFADLSGKQQRIVIIVGALAAALGPLLALIGTLLTMLPMMASGFALVSAAAAPVTLPILAIATAIGLLAAAFATDFMGIRSITENVLGRLLELFQTVWPRIRAIVTRVMDAIWTNTIKPIMTAIRTLWETHGQALMTETVQTFTVVRDAVVPVMQELWQVISTILGIIRPFWEASFGVLLTVAQFTFNTILTVVTGIVDTVLSVIRATLALIRGDWKQAWTIITDLLGRQAGRIKSIITGFATTVERTITMLIDGIIGLFRNLWTTLVGGSIIPEMLGDILAAFAGFARDAISWAGDMVDDVVSTITDKVSKFKKAGKSLISSFIDGIKDKIGDVGSAVGNIAQKARDKLPFSPAKEGPLSDLDESGEAFVETFAEGVEGNLGRAAGASEEMAAAGHPSLAGAAAADGGGKAVRVGEVHLHSDTDSPDRFAKDFVDYTEELL